MMEWENQPHSQLQQQSAPVHTQAAAFTDGGDVVNGAAMYVKVMTDEQMEILRTQISVYATICEQLVEMHKAVTAQQDLAGVRLGNPYCDPLVTSIGHKITSRQRWTPTPLQLQILESIFDQGTGTPSKQKIKDITSELSQHGQISETNVYNWFQNRRARSKRKQLNSTSNNAETEAETDADSPKEKKTRAENLQSQQSDLGLEETSSYLQNSHEIVGSAGMDSMCGESSKMEPVFQSDLPSRSIGQLSFIDSMLETPRIDHLIGKMEVPGNYDHYHSGEDYNMTG